MVSEKEQSREMVFEYKVVPAPERGRKKRGIRRPDDRFAFAVQETINEMAQLGWEFLRAETLPHLERIGLTGRQTTQRSLLVFRRPVEEHSPTASLEATLREVEKPQRQQVAAVVELSEPAQELEPEADQTFVEQVENGVEERVAEPQPSPRQPKENMRPSTIDASSFPEPEAPSVPPVEGTAIYTKSEPRESKSGALSALPAALRNRASQSR